MGWATGGGRLAAGGGGGAPGGGPGGCSELGPGGGAPGGGGGIPARRRGKRSIRRSSREIGRGGAFGTYFVGLGHVPTEGRSVRSRTGTRMKRSRLLSYLVAHPREEAGGLPGRWWRNVRGYGRTLPHGCRRGRTSGRWRRRRGWTLPHGCRRWRRVSSLHGNLVAFDIHALQIRDVIAALQRPLGARSLIGPRRRSAEQSESRRRPRPPSRDFRPQRQSPRQWPLLVPSRLRRC